MHIDIWQNVFESSPTEPEHLQCIDSHYKLTAETDLPYDPCHFTIFRSSFGLRPGNSGNDRM